MGIMYSPNTTSKIGAIAVVIAAVIALILTPNQKISKP